jgi:ketosteroid isomerase-like protein
VVRNIQLAAIDLSAISRTCGGQLDGILGLDLLEKLGVTIDLERGVVHLGASPQPSSDISLAAGIEDAVNSCLDAFNRADAERLASCFDSEFALTSPRGELHGRDEAVNYLRQYFGANSHGHLSFSMRDARPLGELAWGLYEYSIETGSAHTGGSGIMLCRKAEDHWYVLSMYESPSVAATAKP